MNPLAGTATIPAAVAHVFPVAKTNPACLGATSRWLTLTPASVSALSASPTSTAAAAAKTSASAAPPPAAPPRRRREHTRRGSHHPHRLKHPPDEFHRALPLPDQRVRPEPRADAEHALDEIREDGERRQIRHGNPQRLFEIRREPTQQTVPAPRLRELRDAYRPNLARVRIRPDHSSNQSTARRES